jgi:hypothetical protein
MKKWDIRYKRIDPVEAVVKKMSSREVLKGVSFLLKGKELKCPALK